METRSSGVLFTDSEPHARVALPRFRDIDYRMIRLFATLADPTEFNVIRS